MIEHNDHDILLGLDWFSITKAGVYPAIKEIHFPSDKIYLNNEFLKTDNMDQILFIEIDDDIEIPEDIEWNTSGKEIEPMGKLSKMEQKLFKELLLNSKFVFASNVLNLGACSVRKHVIQTNSETPIYIPPYRLSLRERNELKIIINDMENAQIIRKSKSPWSAPIILIPKKDKSVRLCVDYRKLNAITITQSWPIPRVQDILDDLSGSTIFSAIDLKAGFWQILMDENSIEKTAFSTPDGHYEFIRLPFGLKNAPSDFSRIMFIILGDLKFVKIFFDDLIIHSSSLKEHI